MKGSVADKLKDFFSRYPEQKYKSGEMLLSPAKSKVGLFYLEIGRIRQGAISSKGDEITVNTLRAPALFPVGSIINDTPVQHYYVADTDVAVRMATKTEGLEFLHTNPDVVFDLVQRIYKGLDGYFLRMESLLAGSAKIRLLTHILIYVRRFGDEKIKVTETALAAQSGITRETVSRLLKQFKQKGIVSLKKGILSIDDMSQLELELSKN